MFLCLGLTDIISDPLVHQLLLIAGSYIYTSKSKNCLPLLTAKVLIQLIPTIVKVEQAAPENNSIKVFREKWPRPLSFRN